MSLPSASLFHENRPSSWAGDLKRHEPCTLCLAPPPAAGPPRAQRRPAAHAWRLHAMRLAAGCRWALGKAPPLPSAPSPLSTAPDLPHPAAIPAQEPGENGSHEPGGRADAWTSRERGLTDPLGKSRTQCVRWGLGYHSQVGTGKWRWGGKCSPHSKRRSGEGQPGVSQWCPVPR